jgi:hypothetical protein
MRVCVCVCVCVSLHAFVSYLAVSSCIVVLVSSPVFFTCVCTLCLVCVCVCVCVLSHLYPVLLFLVYHPQHPSLMRALVFFSS